MARALLYDTDVLIEYLRGRDAAKDFFRRCDEADWLVSAITTAELFAGVRNGEQDELQAFLSLFDAIEVDAELARRAGLLRNQYLSTHGTGLADAVIAASALASSATLVTFNERHYPMVDDILVPWDRNE